MRAKFRKDSARNPERFPTWRSSKSKRRSREEKVRSPRRQALAVASAKSSQ